MWRIRLSLALGLAALSTPIIAQNAFDPGRAGFAVGVNNEIYPFLEFATFVLPEERLVLRILDAGDSTFGVDAPAGRLEKTDEGRWVWNAPRTPGRFDLNFTLESDGDAIVLHVFVQMPAGRLRDGFLNGYPIGQYPPPIRGEPLSARPEGFIEVHESELGVRVSPHFVLGQFVTDTSDRYPKYIVLRERLLLKLEALLERVNARGYPADSLAILSGYRTPQLNETVGGTPYSRHIYGGAAAVIIDRDPLDGTMDDLDGDGQPTDADIRMLFALADELTREPDKRYLQGGLAVYTAVPWRGPYLHIDARGYRARWRSDEDEQRLREPRARHPRDFPAPDRIYSIE